MRFIRGLAALVLLGTAPVIARSTHGGPRPDKRLMTDQEYNSYLDQLEKALPRWERELRRIDAEKIPGISYAHGKAVMDDQGLTLMSIRGLQGEISRERISRRVSRELVMGRELGTISDGFGNQGQMLKGGKHPKSSLGSQRQSCYLRRSASIA